MSNDNSDAMAPVKRQSLGTNNQGYEVFMCGGKGEEPGFTYLEELRGKGVIKMAFALADELTGCPAFVVLANGELHQFGWEKHWRTVKHKSWTTVKHMDVAISSEKLSEQAILEICC